MKLRSRLARAMLATTVLLCLTAFGSSQTVYSAKDSFSIVSGNPNGVWSYGRTLALGGEFLRNNLARSHSEYGVERWTEDIEGTLTPHVSKSTVNAVRSVGTVFVDPYQLHMHPGPHGEYSVLKFTAPTSGMYRFNVRFAGLDVYGTTTDVHVLKAGVSLWSSLIDDTRERYFDTEAGFFILGSQGWIHYADPSAWELVASGTGTIHLESGETLDAVVGAGSNDTYWHDTTGVEFDVTALPQNQLPVAIDDFYGIDQLTTLNQGAPGILVNDTDPDNDTLSVGLIDGPTNHSAFQLSADGSFTYTPMPFFYGTDTFTYRVFDGTTYSDPATVHITVRQPGSTGHITGGGKIFQDGTKRTFGLEAKVKSNQTVQGNLEFHDHALGLIVNSTDVLWIYAPNSSVGYFSGTCTMNGQAGYTYFVELHDLGEPGTNDSFSIWVFDSTNTVVYSSGGGLAAGGNINIH